MSVKVSLELNDNQEKSLKVITDHMGQRMGGQVSKAQAIRALFAYYLKRERLEGGNGGEDSSGSGS